jgi:hypothetical protein
MGVSSILKNPSGKGRTYVEFNGKEGVFVHTDKDTKEKSTFSQIDYAHLQKIEYKKDHFDGQDIHKAQVHLKGAEDDSHVVLTFNMGTFAGARMLGLLNAAIGKPDVAVKWNTGATKAGEKLLNGDVADKDFVWVSLRQDGAQQTLKPKYDTPDGKLPEAIKVPIGGGKTALNMDPVNAVSEALFAKIAEKLGGVAQAEAEAHLPAQDEADAADFAQHEAEAAADAPRG